MRAPCEAADAAAFICDFGRENWFEEWTDSVARRTMTDRKRMGESSNSSQRRAASLVSLKQSRPLALAVATSVSAVIVATSAFQMLPVARSQNVPASEPRETGPAPSASNLNSGPASPEIVELQRQVTQLRNDLLDERERRIGRQLAANGVALVVLAVVIGVGGLWFYARFRAIAAEARIGASNAGRYVLAPSHLLAGTQTLRAPPSDGFRLLPLPETAGSAPELGTRASASGSSRESSPTPPRLQAFRTPLPSEDRGDPAGRVALSLDAADLDWLEETIADCTEAIRLDPDSPQLYLERAGAYSRLDRYEEAVADYDRAIGLDADNAAAYLGRCHANSELGRHEEAIEDYDRAVHLDPTSASASGDG